MSPGSQKSGLLQPKAKNHPQGQVSTLNLCAIGRVHGPVRGPKLAAAAFLQQTQSFFPVAVARQQKAVILYPT